MLSPFPPSLHPSLSYSESKVGTEGEGGDLIASFQQKRIQKIQLRNAWMWLPVNIQYPPPPSNLMIYFCLVFLDE